jgi:hypothetical protein
VLASPDATPFARSAKSASTVLRTTPQISATPPLGDSRIEAIAEAARRLDELKRNRLNPEEASEAELKKRMLTNLYNTRPTWLQNAHKSPNEAVLAVYGEPPDLSGEEVLQNLLALNLERFDARYSSSQ